MQNIRHFSKIYERTYYLRLKKLISTHYDYCYYYVPARKNEKLFLLSFSVT